jgi:ferredoxin
MSYYLKDGVPYINGKPAQQCRLDADTCYHDALAAAVSIYVCPECGSHLASAGFCLNACHLSATSYLRFIVNMQRLLDSLEPGESKP